MSLHTYPDVIQGTDEWHTLRRGMVTASSVGALLTPTLQVADNETSRGLLALLVAERITGYTEPTYQSADMFRGQVDEPLAVDAYAKHYGVAAQTCGFMVNDDHGFPIGYSPDALIGDDGLLEVKSRQQKIHLRTILDGTVPAANMAQIQCALLVSGRDWCDYVSYCGGMPLLPLRVLPDPDWRAAIAAAVETFEERAERMLDAYNEATQGLAQTVRVDYHMEVVI